MHTGNLVFYFLLTHTFKNCHTFETHSLPVQNEYWLISAMWEDERGKQKTGEGKNASGGILSSS